MNLLKAFISHTSKKPKATYKNRGKFSDQHKNLCKVLSQVFTGIPHDTTTIDSTSILKQMHEYLRLKISINSSHLTDLKRKSKNRHKTIESIIQSPSTIDSSSSKITDIHQSRKTQSITSKQLYSRNNQEKLIIIEDSNKDLDSADTENYETQQRCIYLDEALNDVSFEIN